MKTKAHLHLACLALAILPASLNAQAIKYMGGSGTILEGTKSADGEYAIVLNEAGDNVVVNLREKNEVLKLKADDDWQFPYFPGLNHGSLEVAWGPDQEGSRFGILFYGAKWETAKAFLIEVDPEFGSQTDIMPVLSSASLTSAKANGVADPQRYAYSFNRVRVVPPNGGMVITDPLDVTVSYHGEIPKSEEGSISGSFGLRLKRTGDGPKAEPLRIGGGAAPVPVGKVGGMDATAFKALRKQIDEEIKGRDVKKVKVHRPSPVKGRKLSYMGHLEANVTKRLVYVDSENDENETYILYYWKDGLLVSAYEVREGLDTEISEVAKTIEIYNFVNQKLVGWIRDGNAVDPNEFGFADVGSRVLDQSIERAGVIYNEVGAD